MSQNQKAGSQNTLSKQLRARQRTRADKKNSQPKPSTSKPESVSKYFQKMSQNFEAVVKTPQKCSPDDSFDDDFKTPLALRKVDNAVWKLNKGPKTKSKSKKGKSSRNATIEIVKQNFTEGDNPDHLQMAIALSKSSYEVEYGNSAEEPKNETPDIVSILQKVKPTDLERFGFRSNKGILGVGNRKAPGESTRKMNSRFKYITPVLTIRTVKDRESLISSKISFILSETGQQPLIEESQIVPLSTTLQKFQPYYSLFDCERIYDGGCFYVDDLRLPKTTHKCGFLLKDYSSILGREPSPERTKTVDQNSKNTVEKDGLSMNLTGSESQLNYSLEARFIEEVETSQAPVVVNSTQHSSDSHDLTTSKHNFSVDTPNRSHEKYQTSGSSKISPDRKHSTSYPKPTLLSPNSKSWNSAGISGLNQENFLTSTWEKGNSIIIETFHHDINHFETMESSDISSGRKVETSQSKTTLFTQNSRSSDSLAKDSGISSTFRRSITPDLFGSDDETQIDYLNVDQSLNSSSHHPRTAVPKQLEIIDLTDEDDQKSPILSNSQKFRPSFYNLDEFEIDEGAVVNLEEVDLTDKTYCVNELKEKYGCIKPKHFRLSGNKSIRKNFTRETTIDSPCETSSSISYPSPEGEKSLHKHTDFEEFSEKSDKNLSLEGNQSNIAETSLNSNLHDDVFLNNKVDLDKSTKSSQHSSLSDTILLDKIEVDISEQSFTNSNLEISPVDTQFPINNCENVESESQHDNHLNYSPPTSPDVFGSSPPQYYEEPVPISQFYESIKEQSTTPCVPQRLSCLSPSNGYNSSELDITGYLNSMLNKDQHSFDQDKIEIEEELCLSQESQESVIADEELNYSMHFATPAKASNKSLKRARSLDLEEIDEGPKSPLALDLPEDPPPPESSIENVVSTPDNYIIKTKNVTPMPDYDKMSTPIIAKELEKVGVKPLKRARGAKFLRYIYESTHPLKGTRMLRKSDSDEEERVIKRRRRSLDGAERVQQTEEPIVSLSEIVGDRLTKNERLEDLIFERKQSAKIPSCRVPLQIVWHNFLSCNPGIRENILLYEPLQLESLHLMLKELGFKFHVQDLLTFLDKKCITIRTAQNQGRRKR